MLPLITPPQSQALLDGANCNRTWYLFFDNLKSAAATANGIVQFGTRLFRGLLDTQGLPNGTLWFETDTALVYQWRVTDKSMGWVAILGIQRVQVTATHGTTTNIDAPSSGAPELMYLIDQDGTGGGAIHWRNGFGWASDNVGQGLANTRSIFRFYLDSVSGLYLQTAAQLMDMTQ